ncbi:hypothetical protein [Oerskovia jenensis]|uniref:hypothetical protein n=1 Tax=Oerskovia jenensis TaxID=162169 RepID=UPI0036DEC7B0
MSSRRRRRAARRAREGARLAALAVVGLAVGLALCGALLAGAFHLFILEPLRGLAHLIGATP